MNMPAWLERAAPGNLDIFLSNSASPRKSGLFVRQLCRDCSGAFADPRSLAALEAADRHEAGEIDDPTYQAAMQEAARAAEEAEARLRAARDLRTGNWTESYGAAHHAWTATSLAREIAIHGYYRRAMADLMRVVAASTCPRSTSRKRAARAIRHLFLEHFGDIQRPIALDPSWRTGTVVALATSIHADQAFEHMPILGDALEDAGCADADILGHCRGGTLHARGCWVVDLILSKDR